MKRDSASLLARALTASTDKIPPLSLPHTRFLPSIRALLFRLALLFEREKKKENEYVGEKANGREAGSDREMK